MIFDPVKAQEFYNLLRTIEMAHKGIMNGQDDKAYRSARYALMNWQQVDDVRSELLEFVQKNTPKQPE